jgi:hypothetical protein
LNEDFDFLLWLDVDTLIIRDDIDIRSVIEPGVDLYLSWHGPETAARCWPNFSPHFNTGVMLIRNGSWSSDFFSRVWEVGQIDSAPWRDQSTIIRLLGYDNVHELGSHDPAWFG